MDLVAAKSLVEAATGLEVEVGRVPFDPVAAVSSLAFAPHLLGRHLGVDLGVLVHPQAEADPYLGWVVPFVAL